MLGAWCLVLGAWCLMLGAWCLMLGTLGYQFSWCHGFLLWVSQLNDHHVSIIFPLHFFIPISFPTFVNQMYSLFTDEKTGLVEKKVRRGRRSAP